MYSSGYSQANLGFAAMKKPRSKGKSCGYYVKLVFFFSSLIQSLIIVSLVLFLVYGQPQQTEEEKRVQELEQIYSRLSLENVALRANEKNITQKLNFTLTEKKIADRELFTLRKLVNISAYSISILQIRWRQCEVDRKSPVPNLQCSPLCLEGNSVYFRNQLQQTQAILQLVRANFTEKMQVMSLDLENANKAKIFHHLEAIELRRDKHFLQEQIEAYEKKCKEDFVQSLQGIPDVTREFLKRVDNLFSKHMSFQLTCEKQSTQLEDIRTNCSSLSTEVENKLQEYLDKVGSQVTTTIGENAKCMTVKRRLNEDATWCKQNRSAIIEENKQVLKQVQLKFDQETQKLLLEASRMTGEKKLQEQLVSVKENEIKMLDAKVKDLNASLTSCKAFPKSQFPGSTSFSGMPAFGTSIGSSGLGSSGQGTSLYGRTAGGSVGSNGIGLGSTGLQKPGSASSVATGSGSSTGLGLPAWPGVGSHGTGLAGLGSTGSGMAGLGNPGLSSTAFGSIGAGGIGAERTGLGSVRSNEIGLSSAGSNALTRIGSGGAGFGSTGSSAASLSTFGGGKVTSGSDSLLTAQINHHLRELHRYAKTN